jgi:hypothetical protein
MRREWPGALALATLFAVGCGGGATQKAEPPKGGLGEQVGDTAFDTQVMKEANDAAGSVVRVAADCDAVKAALPEANRRLDEAAGKLRTATGRTSLDAIRKQVKAAAEACP